MTQEPAAPPRFSPRDIVAGVSVALLLVPQSLAFARLAGLPPQHGLYAAILPPIAAAFFASSPYLQTGPVAITSLLTLAALSVNATPGTAHYIALAPLLALVVGVARIGLGLVRAGWLAYLMSSPVVTGFTAAAALLIIGSQFPATVGSVSEGDVVPRLFLALSTPNTWHLSAIGLSVLTIAVVVGLRRLTPVFPGILVAVVVGFLVSVAIGYRGEVVGEIPAGLPRLSLAVPWASLPELIVPGFVIALIGFAEPSAIARTYAAEDRTIWSPDRELVSQGVANLAAGISGAYPVGGSFSRTSLNHAAGGKTRWSGAVTGLAVLAFIPLTGVIARLPTAVLAAIVIASVLKLVTLRRLLRLRNFSVPQAAIGWMTFGLTLVLAPRVEMAVLSGVLLSAIVHLWREQQVHVDAEFHDGTLTLRPRGVLFFGSAPRLDRTLVTEFAANPEAERLVIELQLLGRIDYTGAEALKRLAEDGERAGLEVRVVNVPPHTGGLLYRVFGEGSGVLGRS